MYTILYLLCIITINKIYAVCMLLFQLMMLLNKMRNDPFDTVLE